VNAIAGWVIAAVLGPFAAWPPLVGMTVMALLTAIVLLIAFKWTSNQRAIADAKRQVQAGLFELRLFQDDPRLMARAAGGLLLQQARYLRYAFVPVLWVFLPLSILIAHLDTYYSVDALHPGASAIVIVHTTGDGGTLTLEAPPGLRVETPCVWAPSRREGAWRIAADREGDYNLRVTWPGASAPLTKQVRVTRADATPTNIARPSVRPAGRTWDEFLHPGESPLPPDAPIDAIAITYPPRALDVGFGFTLPWVITFLLITTAIMLVLRPFLRVTF